MLFRTAAKSQPPPPPVFNTSISTLMNSSTHNRQTGLEKAKGEWFKIEHVDSIIYPHQDFEVIGSLILEADVASPVQWKREI